MDASSLALATAAALDDEDTIRQLHLIESHYSHQDYRPKELGIQRSFSMPPALFETEGAVPPATFEAAGGTTQSSRNRERSGMCIQRNQTSSRQLRHRMLESKSDDELTTSGAGAVEEGEGEVGKEGGGTGETSDSYPRGRRNAFRGTRLTRRATCAADGSMMVAAGVTVRSSVPSDRPG